MEIKKIFKFALGFIVVSAGSATMCYYDHKQDYIQNKHVKKGADNWRSFHRSDGTPKIAYDNPYDAKKAAINSMLISGESFNAYLRADGKYSIGHGYDSDNWPFTTIGKVNRFLNS
mgnify:CR=1